MTIHRISEEALNKILAYLGTKPYVEVFNLVQAVTADIQKNAQDSLKEETTELAN